MRLISFLAFGVLGLLCLPLSAQMKVRKDSPTSTGRVQIGYEAGLYNLTFGQYTNPNWPNNGMHGLEYWDGGMNFYIPWPASHSTNYTLYISNQSHRAVGIGKKPNGVYKLDVLGHIRSSGNMYAPAFYNSSDERLKTDIEPLEENLDKILQLNSVSYRYRPRDFSADLRPGEDAVINEDKQRMIDATMEQDAIVESEDVHNGFIAQEVAEVLPDLVHTDPEGFLALDYNSFIALLVGGMQEQQTQIDELTARLDALETQVSQAPALAMESSSDPELGALSQNNPNPFTASTEIGYQLIPNAQSAQLMIFDFQGQPVKTFDLELRTEGSFTLQGSELRPGLYFYVLIVDGQEADLKRMILTE